MKKITPPKKTWLAVRVVAGPGACEAVKRATAKRFLTKDAPRLPLGDCDHQDKCQCKYQHLSDRRGQLRRTVDSGFGIPKTVPDNQRRPGERRERKR
ncbi:MAG: hypothetical protein ACRES2_09405 [Steroidobacteraceae bacterium]